MSAGPSKALAHIRVLDVSRVRAGPTCCRILGDFGADIIKIEAPPGVDPNEGISGARAPRADGCRSTGRNADEAPAQGP